MSLEKEFKTPEILRGLVRAQHFSGRERTIRPEIETMIEEGKSLGEMTEVTNQSISAMHLYITENNLHNHWRNQRDKRKKEDKEKLINEAERRRFLGAIIEGVLRHNYETKAEWSAKKAYEYLSAHPTTTYTFKVLEKIFRVYERANKSGERVSLEEIGKRSKTEIRPNKLWYILHRVGLKTICRSRRPDLTSSDVNTIWRARDVKMPNTDIGYFTDMNSWNVSRKFKRLKVQRPFVKQELKRFGRGAENILSYRLASQIYEARDAGYFREFSVGEMAQFFDTSEKVIDYALSHRGEIAPQISRALKRIYPKRKSKKPYRVKSDVIN